MPLPLLATLLVLSAGLGFLAARMVLRNRLELRLAQGRVDALARERDDLRAGAGTQEAELRRLRDELVAKAEAVATLTSRLKGLEDTAEARLDGLRAAQARLSETFASLSAQALKANSEAFLQLARTQMQGGQAEAALDLESRRQAIAGLLSPVQASLAAMQEQVRSLARERAAAEATLGANLQNLVATQQGLQGETAKLAKALRRPEVRGQWGEIQLRNVVEFAGMKEHVDFETQDSMDTEDGKRRPDLVVNLPGGKKIAVDAKAPLRAYLEALDVEGPAREERLDAVAAQVRAQVDNLADKRYFEGLAESPEFVVLFLPLEALFSTALERDPHLLEQALARHVILASPTTLVALLKSAAYGWAQERIQANAEEIQKLGTELLERVVTMAEHTDALRKALVASVEAFNRFAGSLETRVLVTGARLHALGIRPAARKRPRPAGLAAPAAIHLPVSGLPRLGVAGETPALDVEAFENGEAALTEFQQPDPGL